MESQGYRLPQTAADDSAVGTLAWSNPDNVKSEDGSFAIAQHAVDGTFTTHYLKVSRFGFSIPANATIRGIAVSIIRKANDSSGPTRQVKDSVVSLQKSDGSIGAANKADTSVAWPTSLATKTYGGQADLWSNSWTPDDINDNDFGVRVSASLAASSGTLIAYIEAISVIVYYTVPTPPAQKIPKQYIAKISRAGVYLGILPNVIEDFKLSQEINTAFSSLKLEVSDTIDRQFQEPLYITTEAGEIITTEDAAALTTERAPDIVGNTNSQALIRNNNDIDVYEISSNYPNGKIVFSGWISKFRAVGPIQERR